VPMACSRGRRHPERMTNAVRADKAEGSAHSPHARGRGTWLAVAVAVVLLGAATTIWLLQRDGAKRRSEDVFAIIGYSGIDRDGPTQKIGAYRTGPHAGAFAVLPDRLPSGGRAQSCSTTGTIKFVFANHDHVFYGCEYKGLPASLVPAQCALFDVPPTAPACLAAIRSSQ